MQIPLHEAFWGVGGSIRGYKKSLLSLTAGDSSQDEAEEDVKQITVSELWPREEGGYSLGGQWGRLYI